MFVDCHLYTNTQSLQALHAEYGWSPPHKGEYTKTVSVPCTTSSTIRDVLRDLGCNDGVLVYCPYAVGGGANRLHTDTVVPSSADLHIRTEHPNHVWHSGATLPQDARSVPTYVHYTEQSIEPHSFAGVCVDLHVKQKLVLKADAFAGMSGSVHFAPCRPSGLHAALVHASVASVTMAEGTQSVGTLALSPLGTVAEAGSREKLVVADPARLAAIVLPASLLLLECAVLAATNITTLDIAHTRVHTIERFAFAHCYKLRSCRLPHTLLTLGDHAFFCCHALAELDMGACDNLAELPRSMAERCAALRRVTLPPRCVVVHEDAFRGCTALVAVTLPRTVHAIKDAFTGCTSLRTVVCLHTQSAACGLIGNDSAVYVNEIADTGCEQGFVWARILYGLSPRPKIIVTKVRRSGLSPTREPRRALSPWLAEPPHVAIVSKKNAFVLPYRLRVTSLQRLAATTAWWRSAMQRSTRLPDLPNELWDLITSYIAPWGTSHDCHMPIAGHALPVAVWSYHAGHESVPPLLRRLLALPRQNLLAQTSEPRASLLTADALCDRLYRSATQTAPLTCPYGVP